MRGGLLWSRSSWVVMALFGAACSNIIGISDYKIDPSLDPPSGDAGHGGTSSAGGKLSQGGETSPTEGGSESQGGSGATAPVGGSDAGVGGSDAAGGEGGGTGDCASACDDQIDCTVDSCTADGECVHTTDSSQCDADPGECLTCQLGLGCVATPLTQVELLIDKDFDEVTGDWIEVVDYPDTEAFILSEDSLADTDPNSAWFAQYDDPSTIVVQPYADIYQFVTVPANARSLVVSGVYELYSGLYDPSDEFMRAALFNVGSTSPLFTFHDWDADAGDADDWTAFEYSVPQNQLTKLLDKDLTFDLYGYLWDSAYYFDTLSLQAGVCE